MPQRHFCLWILLNDIAVGSSLWAYFVKSWRLSCIFSNFPNGQCCNNATNKHLQHDFSTLFPWRWTLLLKYVLIMKKKNWVNMSTSHIWDSSPSQLSWAWTASCHCLALCLFRKELGPLGCVYEDRTAATVVPQPGKETLYPPGVGRSVVHLHFYTIISLHSFPVPPSHVELLSQNHHASVLMEFVQELNLRKTKTLHWDFR